MTHSISARSRMTAVAVGALAASAFATLPAGAQVAAQGGAQSAPTGRLQAWVGCWSAEQSSIGATTTIGPIVCIVPTADAGVVEVATLQEGKIVSRERLDPGGRERPIEAKGCTGTQRATWSADGRRIYLRSAGSCETVPRSTSGILAMTPSGQWLDVQGISAGDGSNVRVARYRDIGLPRSVPGDILAALGGHDLATQSARIAAGAPLKLQDVVEASKAADAAVVEAWILERNQPFALTARDLVALADAGVSDRVTDALVAVSNPKSFALASTDDDAWRRGRGPDLIGGRGSPGYPDPYGTPWGWGYYSPYGYGNGYGGYYGYPGFYNPPVVIVTGRDASHGKMVKGQGYTQGENGTASEGTSTRTTRAPSSGGSSSGGSSSGSSGGSSSGGSSRAPDPAPSSTTRTAKPRS